MNYSFEYIDIILLAMIAGFIFLRLRGILGKRTGFEGKAPAQFDKILKEAVVKQTKQDINEFDEKGQKEFLKGAKIAYETIITDFSDNDNKLTVIIDFESPEAMKAFGGHEELKAKRAAAGAILETTVITPMSGESFTR